MNKETIETALRVRDALLKTDKENPNVDIIEKEITEELRKNFKNYEVDFILETLTMFGQAPNVIYDDNGNFAVSASGYQPVVAGSQKIEGMVSVFVEKKQWKKTIRLALKHYLNSLK